MEENNDVAQGSSPEQVVTETSAASEGVKTPESSAPHKTEEKVVPYSRFKEVNDQLENLRKQPTKVINKALDVEDYIDISASLEGLDQREKERLAKEHKLSGRPLSDIRKDEDFQLWQSAYREKAEKERLALKPSGTQAEADRPKSFMDRLSGASMEDKEKLLTEAGLYKQMRPKADRVSINKFER